MTLRHSGITREYLPPFSLNAEIPTIEDIIENPSNCSLFIEHVTKNHKGLNWKIYRYKLSSENVKCFIYAFAYMAKNINPSNNPWQFESNARRLQREINRRNIELSKCEEQLLCLCKSFIKEAPIKKLRLNELDSIMNSLEQLYLG